ncbi:protein TonB [Sphingomonas naasensis]|uniref:Energy transducer TonB n=1 Tax=Sphingomonas naasensis TaxID=1344951 RepID=A0A4V3QW70_9SPHN|nr:hypothetical protein [Sphingomonas naasensis]NIJ21713.1 protein TonB [Sphingomonas naasensis]TGX41362.1 hypothetical protein E5A74_12020 [Sphingomonas naasensis]
MPVAESIATRPSASVRLRASLGQRGIAFGLALLVELLVALLLWFVAPAIRTREEDRVPAVFGIEASGDHEAADRKEARARQPRTEPSKPRPLPPKPVEPPPETPDPPTPQLPADFVKLTRPDFRAADIADKGAPHDATPRRETAANDAGGAPGDSPVIAKGPNGQSIYRGDWYRMPTAAQIIPYISRRALNRAGEGVILCRIVADHRVEDCQELRETPRGSGYAGTARQAAWQFRVRAPRINGREVLGSLVQITVPFAGARDDAADE